MNLISTLICVFSYNIKAVFSDSLGYSQNQTALYTIDEEVELHQDDNKANLLQKVQSVLRAVPKKAS